MLREYEFTFISKTDISEAAQSKVFSGYEEILKREGGDIVKRDDWGVKKLAYPIKKNFKGHYVHYDCVTNSDNIAECERLLRIDENILRFLVIKTGEDVDIEARKKQVADEQIKRKAGADSQDQD